ncbi:unnamed protein product [Rhizophagus irregularis]|nr:unnamed protein product [Rhizophagus irregularis]
MLHILYILYNWIYILTFKFHIRLNLRREETLHIGSIITLLFLFNKTTVYRWVRQGDLVLEFCERQSGSCKGLIG